MIKSLFDKTETAYYSDEEDAEDGETTIFGDTLQSSSNFEDDNLGFVKVPRTLFEVTDEVIGSVLKYISTNNMDASFQDEIKQKRSEIDLSYEYVEMSITENNFDEMNNGYIESDIFLNVFANRSLETSSEEISFNFEKGAKGKLGSEGVYTDEHTFNYKNGTSETFSEDDLKKLFNKRK
jgi:hypothetical protein